MLMMQLQLIITTPALCNNLLLRGTSQRYCEKLRNVVDLNVEFSQSYDIGFSFFVHTEIAKNLVLSSQIQAPSFSTFTLTGNMVIENCQIVVNSITSQAVLISSTTISMQITDSLLVANFTSSVDMLNAATISMNSSSVTIQRCNITATLTTHNNGNLSGISNNCHLTTINQVQMNLLISINSAQYSSCGAIIANIDNALINIKSSQITGIINAIFDNGPLVGAGNNVTFNISQDSQISLEGVQIQYQTDITLCNGLCGQIQPTIVRAVSSVYQTTIGSTNVNYILNYNDQFNNSEIDFDPTLQLNFNGIFSVIINCGTIRNLKITGSYSVSSSSALYANIFGINNAIQLNLYQIRVIASINALSSCKLNIITNNITSQFIINSFQVSGSYQTINGPFNIIASMGGSEYIINQTSILKNYQFVGTAQVSVQMSSLGIYIVKLSDLHISNSVIVTSNSVQITGGLLVGKSNNQLFQPCSGNFVFNNIHITQRNSDGNQEIVNGVIFQLLICTNIIISNFEIQYQSQSDFQNQPSQQSIFGNVIATNVNISHSKIVHSINASYMQRFGLITLDYYQQSINQIQLTIDKIDYQFNLFSCDDGSGVIRNIGMVGVAVSSNNYTLSSIQVKDSKIQMLVSVSTAGNNIGVIIGYAIIMPINVTNTDISDSKIDTPLSTQIGVISGSVTGILSITNINVKNLVLNSQQNTGFIGYIQGTASLNNISVKNWDLSVSIQASQSAVFCGVAVSAQIFISSFVLSKTTYSGGNRLISGIVFGSYTSSQCSIVNSQFVVEVKSQFPYTLVQSFTSDLSSYIDVQNSQFSTSNNCFSGTQCSQTWTVVQGSTQKFQ
ncbi:Hypothetical_protein [Hexamita inflata]|uniref:Hypothetical_protein n=1 Tax=Hexamita inflata TaxID=28002 RepID=A0AA86QHI4_9EUKA|nr:Hypothetical protein HINF_LOCUS47149 [Hexamita inflata]